VQSVKIQHLTVETLLMKKINLSIPTPCHAKWDSMTPYEQGKFCASCQKNVIDFTNMSDRQIGEFFKKPPSSVCGRVYNDQLHRDIEIPKKRIPWIKYFFQITWPAWMLFLKSCGMKDSSSGKINVESKKSHNPPEGPIGIVGMMWPQITPVDSSAHQMEEVITKGEITGVISNIDTIDTTGLMVDSLEQGEAVYKPMDTVVVVPYPSIKCRVTMGALSTTRVDPVLEQENPEDIEPLTMNEINCKIFPNPVRTGTHVTISDEDGNGLPERIQLLSSSGQLVLSVGNNEIQKITIIQIPANITAGIYFLQMINTNGKMKTSKLIVTK
jgi:hypothetical protein